MTESGETQKKIFNYKDMHLARQHREIIAMESDKALDAILGAPLPATLIQSFSDQDLHFLMHHIGGEDFVPVLAMATSDQWEFLLDVSLWKGDRVHLPGMTKTLELLFRADPKRLMRWAVMEKPALLEYYFFKNMEVRIREHDEDPSDFGDGYVSLDQVFYFRFPQLPSELADSEEGGELELVRKRSEILITDMLKTVAEMDLSVSHGLLLETTSVIPSEIEEEEFRLKTVRLAEKGFMPLHEALGIYQLLEPKNMRRRPPLSMEGLNNDGNLPLPPHSPEFLIREHTLFASALACLDDSERFLLSSEFAALVNRLISANKEGIHDRDGLESAVDRACAYLSLGLEMFGKGGEEVTPDAAAVMIRKYFLEDIFRVGSGAGIRLQTRAVEWQRGSWMDEKGLALGFLGERRLGVVGGLLLPRPLFFDNYVTGKLYREFETRDDLAVTVRELSGIMEIDRMLGFMNPDLDSFSQGFLTYKSLLLTLWAANRLDLPQGLDPIDLEVFRPFFRELFSSKGAIEKDKRDDFTGWLSDLTAMDIKEIETRTGWVIQEMFDELESEYGTVRPEDLDAGLVTHFFLT